MASPDFRTLRLVVGDDIATLTLNRPEQMNLIDGPAHDEMERALHQLREEHDIRVAIIAAEGKCFSAGGNFDFMLELQSSPEKNRHSAAKAVSIIEALTSIHVPVIAAVQGDAIGFGASLALGCDIVVACKDANFADPHVLVGLAAGDGGCLFWPQAAGMLRAKRYLLTGDYLRANRAYEYGLVTDLVDTPEETLPLAQEVAKKIARLSPVAVQGTKRSLNAVMQARAAEVAELAALYEQQSMGSADLKEAVTAIREKRRPRFRNH